MSTTHPLTHLSPSPFPIHPSIFSQALCQPLLAALSVITLHVNMKQTHTSSLLLPQRMSLSFTRLCAHPHIDRRGGALPCMLLLLLFLHLNVEIEHFSASGDTDEWHIIKEGAVKCE